MRIRENLQRAKEQNAKAEYARAVLDEIVAQAEISYPDDLVFDQTEEYLERVDRDLRQRGLTLDDYMRITSKSRDDLHQDYRETTVQSLERSLVLREVMQAEQIVVTEAEIEEEIDRIIAQFGEQAASVRSMFRTPSMRENVKNDLLEQRVLDRIVAIARGEAPELPAPPAQAQESSENQPEEGASS
jgi:trigger factor